MLHPPAGEHQLQPVTGGYKGRGNTEKMDVQTDNMDPPPGESQPSGKIRKGFKLFGKRKPGNIFSIRSKGDANNKSPVIGGKALDGLSETAAPEPEQEPDKEKGQEVSGGEREQAEEEPLGEDGVLAAAPARTSISSASSAKSLSFLSLLRGGRRGGGDRRAHTVSQPVGRQRRGLKGLFGNVKFKSRDKEDKEEAPPSPLLMSSRANSVEIIKEDLTLTPKSQPRSLDSPDTESYEPVKSSPTPDSAATSPSESAPQLTAGSVSRSPEHVPPLPTSAPPMVPGDSSLSSLLADISSLLTFDSITGGGDIMADVEAEWGKASSAISVTEVTPSSTSLFSKPTVSSPPISTPVTTATPPPAAVPTAAASFRPLAKTTSTSSPVSKPSTIITTFTKSSTLTTSSVRLSSDSTPASEPPASMKVKPPPAPTAARPPPTPVALPSLSPPIMSAPSTIIKPSLSSSTPTTAPPNTPATVTKAPSVSPTLTSPASKLASEDAAPPPVIASVSKPGPVPTLPPASAKPPPVTHSPPIPVAITQPPPAKLDPASSLNLHTFTSFKPSLSSAAGQSKAAVTASPACTVTAKMTAVPTSAPSSGSVSAAFSQPTLASAPVGVNKPPPLLVTVPDPSPSSLMTVTSKTQPSPASVSAPSATSFDKFPPTTKPISAPVSLDKMPPAPTFPIPAPRTHAVVPAAATASTALGQVPASQSAGPPASANSVPEDLPAPAQSHVSGSKAPPAPAQTPVSVSKAPPAPAQTPVSVSKAPPAPAQTPVSVSKAPPAPAQTPVSVSKAPPAPAQTPVSVSKAPPAPAQTPVSVSKAPPAPAQTPVSVPKAPPAPAQTPVSVSKAPPAPAQTPVSVPKAPPTPAQTPVSVSKAQPAPAQTPVSVPKDVPDPVCIPVSVSKAHPAPPTAPCPVTSPPSVPAPCLSEAPGSAKMRGSGLASVDRQVASPISSGAQGVQAAPWKTEELHESQTSLQGISREKRTPQVKASGLSKIPVVGGGRAGKIPVRDSQHADDEPSRDPPTPVLEEERPHFNSHDAAAKDNISAVEANVPTSKHSQEESQQPQQPKVLTSSARDSKIPVKHGAQSHTASQSPQSKDPPRTKIPVSKVPVRRAGNKPAAPGGGAQIRK